MSSAKSIVATSVLSAVLVAAVAAPLGYLGYQKLKPMMESKGDGVPRVVMELKAELVQEIQTANDKTRADVQTRLDRNEAQQKAELDKLSGTIRALKEQQEVLIGRVEDMTAKSAAAPMAGDVPGAKADAYNQTILFPLGAVKSPVINARIEEVVANAKTHLAVGPCTTNVFGFSDTLGNDAANLKLSQKRAEYVATQLRSAGVEVKEVKGWGERWLDVYTPDGVKKAKNRRVVIEMTCKTMGTPGNVPST